MMLPENQIGIGTEHVTGYIALFLRICELLQNEKERATRKGRTVTVVPKVEIG
jgi:hypothetical protein